MTSPITPYPRLHPPGDAAWIVKFGDVIDQTTHARVMGLAQALADARTLGAGPQVLKCVPACTTLTVHFHSAGATDAAQALTGTPFHVYRLGFQPGFPCMVGLPAALEMPCLGTPRTAVPERSESVAGRICAVYP